jgi:hypothetical protein
MIKNYQMIIDLSINISEQITPELIRKAKENTVGETIVYIQQVNLDMLQHIINYISNRPDLFNECVYGHLLFKLMSYNADEDLEDTMNYEPDVFENNILLAAEALGPEYANFVRQLYQYQSDEDDDSNAAPVDGSNIIILAEPKTKKEEIPFEEREVLIELLHLCLLDCTIINSSLAPVAGEIITFPVKQEE